MFVIVIHTFVIITANPEEDPNKHTVGLINFEDKKFQGFCRYLLNLKIKYPCNFLYTRSRFFVLHVHVVSKWLALWKYFKRATEIKTSLPSPTGSLYQGNIFMQGRY